MTENDGGEAEEGRMRLGIGLPNTMAHETDRALMLDWARTAEEAGFAYLSTIDKPTTTRGIRSSRSRESRA